MAELQALQLYDQSKDVEGSLIKYREAWSSTTGSVDDQQTEVQRHNEEVLDHLSSLRRRRRRPAGDCTSNNDHLSDALSGIVTDFSADGSKDKEYNRLVATYNLGLVHYSSGKIDAALTGVLPELHKIMTKSEASDDDTLVVIVRMAFLVLDCLIRRHDGDGLGVEPLNLTQNEKEVKIAPQDIVAWLDKTAMQPPSDNGSGGSMNRDEIKFRVHLYKSKLLFLGTNTANAQAATKKIDNDMGARTRTARKELKTAMDLYQNKLSLEKQDKNDESLNEKPKPKATNKGGSKAGGSKLTKSRGSNQSDVSSVTSAAGGSLVTSTSEGVWAAAANSDKGIVASATFEGMPKAPQQTSQAQVGLEGKVKKDNPDLHLGHEAVLYLKANLECLRGNTTKSLKLCSEARSAGRRSRGEDNKRDMKEEDEEKVDNSQSTESQMTNQYDEAIYYNNLALVHQTAGKAYLALHYFQFALDCMESVAQLDDGLSFFWSDGISRPNLSPEILHNASACALQAGDFSTAYERIVKCMDVSPGVYAKRPRSWLLMARVCIGLYAENNCCTSKDLLSQAAACLYKVIHLSSTDQDCYGEAIASLAYVKMEKKDPVGALEVCGILLESDKSISASAVSRHRATCRLYAAEARCLLGDTKAALMAVFGSDDISEAQLKLNAKDANSPLHWLVQGFDGQVVSNIQGILDNQALLYQMLKQGDTKAAVSIIRS